LSEEILGKAIRNQLAPRKPRHRNQIVGACRPRPRAANGHVR
jgi:hypothetical protein